jgi:hypothetical protein
MTDKQSEFLEGSPQVSPQRGITRRRLMRAGFAATPVVLTLSGRSAMASVACLSPSASASINLTHSRPGRSGDVCAGLTPGYWKNAADNHGNFTAQNNRFDSVYILGFTPETMEGVCKLGGGSVDPQELGSHLAAAWCNLAMGWVPLSVLSLLDLQIMWAQRDTGYHPVPGVTWSRAQIVTYLKTTMT